ncbi:MAG: hypothetical protein ISP90_02325 [Nevskia sp.]|nr:hypothetical protein [Nevskia sp.]
MSRTELSIYRAAPLSLQPVAVIPQSYANPGLSLAQIGAIVWAHRKQSLAIALSVVAAASLALRLMPRSYEATAAMMIDYEVNDPLAGKDFPIGLLESYMSTQIELMQSPAVLVPVVQRLHLTGVKRYAAGYSGDAAGLEDWVEKAVAKHLTVEQGRYGSHLIYATYTSPDRNEAAQVANAVADIYAEQTYTRQTGPASDRARRFTAQLEELKDKATRAQEQVSAFRQSTGLLDSDSKVDIEMELLSTLQQRLVEAQNARRVAESRPSADGATADRVLSSTLIQSLKTQLSSQQAELASLRATLGPRHPQVLALQEQMESTRRSLAAELGNYSAGADAELESARQLEAKLRKAVDEQHAKVLDAKLLQDQLSKFLVEQESAQSVYKRALDGYDQIMFASSDHYSNVSTVNRAAPPQRASKPKTLKLLMLGFFAAAFLGLGGPLAWELLFSRRVRCRDDLERDFGIPVLAEFHVDARAGGST